DHATGQETPKLQGEARGRIYHHGRLEANVRNSPGKDQQTARQGRGSARVARPLVSEAAREPPEGPSKRGRRDHGEEADRVAGDPAAAAGRQAPAAGQGRSDPGERGP